jgi:hypothetical protein
MFTHAVRCVVAIVIAAASVAGCASKEEIKGRITGRWGPNPAIQADDVTSVVSNQNRVLTYIITEGGIASFDKETHELVKIPPDLWFRVTEWGFNVGRQDCEIYMDNLFRISREKQRTDTILTGLATAAAGIVTATSQSQQALSVLAAAFGLAIVANDAVFQSYLFTEAPGLVANKVKDLQGTYRDSIEAGYKKDKSTIQTPEQAYNAIQGYYSICLPQSIEGILLKAVSDTSATMPKSNVQGSAANKSKTGSTTSVVNPANTSPILTH